MQVLSSTGCERAIVENIIRKIKMDPKLDGGGKKFMD